jgi:hypothetical protein
MTNPIMRPPAVGDFRAQPPAEYRRPPRHHRGLFWVAVLAALAAVAAGALITATAYVSESEPETAAVAYFHALGRGDAAGALGLGDLPAGPHTYLTSQVLDAALSVAKISDVRVLSVARNGRTARVTLQYQLGSQQVTDAVSLRRHGQGWRLTRTAVPVHLRVEADAGADRMSIAGARLPKTAVLFFPGALPLALDTPNLSLGAPPVVHLDGAQPAAIHSQVSPAGKQRVDAAVRAALQACLSGRVSRGCPLPAESTVVPGSVRGRLTGNIADELTISIAPDAAGLLQISGNVIVNGSYQQLDFDNQPVRRTGPLKLVIRAQCYATAPSRLAWGAPL